MPWSRGRPRGGNAALRTSAHACRPSAALAILARPALPTRDLAVLLTPFLPLYLP